MNDLALVGFTAGLCLNLMLGVALIFAAILRETPMFWRNAEGFPVLLRKMVKLLFHPGFIGTTVVGLLLTRLVIQQRSGSLGRSVMILAIAVQWLLWLTVALIIAWNNLGNLISGAPLHQHEN